MIRHVLMFVALLCGALSAQNNPTIWINDASTMSSTQIGYANKVRIHYHDPSKWNQLVFVEVLFWEEVIEPDQQVYYVLTSKIISILLDETGRGSTDYICPGGQWVDAPGDPDVEVGCPVTGAGSNSLEVS